MRGSNQRNERTLTTIVEQLPYVRSDVLLQLDAVVSVLFGVFAFLFPSYCLSFFTTDSTDGVHWHLCRCVGGLLLGQAVHRWEYARSRDLYTHTSCFAGRITACALLVLGTLHARAFHSKHFTFMTFLLPVCGSIIYAVICALQLLRTGWPLSTMLYFPKEFEFNCLAQFDAFASLAIGSAWLSVPDLLLFRQVKFPLTATHLWLGRCMGALFISTTYISQNAVYFHSKYDRQIAGYGRATINGCILLAQLYSQVAYHEWWTGNHWVGICLFSVWTGLVFYVARMMKRSAQSH